MPCAESLRVQAYFDAEVDAVGTADIERHLEQCAACRALLQDLEQVRCIVRAESSYVCAPRTLRAQVVRGLDEVSGRRERSPASRRTQSFWAGAISGIAGTALAAGVAFLLLIPTPPNPLVEDLVNAHVSSLMSTHLIDVVSTDMHTVKPWFAGRTDVSPVVADLDPQGYRLLGGRADFFDHQRAAVVVYQHGSHVINVFSWAANSRVLPRYVTRNGYHLAFWKTGNIEYCAVSDTARNELMTLVVLLENLGNHEGS